MARRTLVGPSGSGKSTALRAIAGLEENLAFDTNRMHFFDPASGESIGHPLNVGAKAAAAAAS